MSEQALDVKKEEVTAPEGTERTRDCQCFIPRADIYEIEDQIVIVADMPGSSNEDIEITLEKNILTINGYIQPEDMSDYSLVWGEYQVGDFQRSFKLSNEIDQENINAVVKDGVLRLYLPKAAEAKTRKISVKAE